jgi:holo-[acyl-carrier protein] synthase
MIFGIGVDIVRIARIQAALDHFGERFARRILSETEFEGYGKSVCTVAFLAKRFAAKEAAAKALGTGFGRVFGFRHISVVNNHHGRPFLEFHGPAKQLVQSLGISGSHLSLSDEKDYAVAFVTLTAQAVTD